MTKAQREAIELFRLEGLTIVEISYGKKHWKVRCVEGMFVVAATPSDHRWRRNLRALIRRAANDR